MFHLYGAPSPPPPLRCLTGYQAEGRMILNYCTFIIAIIAITFTKCFRFWVVT
jgi:hypothetical protein